MQMLLAAAARAAGQPAPAPAPMAMPMPAGHEMTNAEHAAMKEKCCCEHMGEAGHDMHAPKGQPHNERGE